MIVRFYEEDYTVHLKSLSIFLCMGVRGRG